MPAQLSFKLKDNYSVMIWNPSLINENPSKTISAEFFFCVIFSVFRERNSKEKKIVSSANNILSGLTKSLLKFEEDIVTLTKIANSRIDENGFTISFTDKSAKDISFVPDNNGGICPENATFLRSFVKFDGYVSKLNELRSMKVITDKEFYINRKKAQEMLRNIIDEYYVKIKQLHTEKKTVKIESGEDA